MLTYDTPSIVYSFEFEVLNISGLFRGNPIQFNKEREKKGFDQVRQFELWHLFNIQILLIQHFLLN